MKRFFVILTAVMLAAAFCTAAGASSTDPTTLPTVPSIELPGGEIPTEPVPEETQVPVIPGETQATTPSEPEPTAPEQIPTVTKHPTSEEVNTGGICEFVARADNAAEIIWHMVDPEGNERDPEKVAEPSTPLQIYGLGTDRLVLENIPFTLDCWVVYAEFVNSAGSAFSERALLTVLPVQPDAPVITAQPRSATVKNTSLVILDITAEEPEQGHLIYRWFRNTENSSQGGVELEWLSVPFLSVEPTAEPVYYYCAVSVFNDGSCSEETVSDCACVQLVSDKNLPLSDIGDGLGLMLLMTCVYFLVKLL